MVGSGGKAPPGLPDATYSDDGEIIRIGVQPSSQECRQYETDDRNFPIRINEVTVVHSTFFINDIMVETSNAITMGFLYLIIVMCFVAPISQIEPYWAPLWILCSSKC